MPEEPLIHLVRHGRTDANVEGRYVGWSDDRLNETGREEAAGLAERLAGRGVRHVFTSPVRRAIETAEMLAEAWDASVRTVHDLHEIEVGPWKGLLESEVEERFPEAYDAWRRDPTRLELPGRESLEGVRDRALRGVDQIAHSLLSADAEPAVAVTHLAVLRVLWLTAEGRPLSEYHSVEGPFCEPFPLRWTGRGKIVPAGPAPTRDDSR